MIHFVVRVDASLLLMAIAKGLIQSFPQKLLLWSHFLPIKQRIFLPFENGQMKKSLLYFSSYK
jgi:hypothetical protein